MATKSSSRKTKKEDGVSFKSLLPLLFFSTAVVVVVSVIGRRATEK